MPDITTQQPSLKISYANILCTTHSQWIASKKFHAAHIISGNHFCVIICWGYTQPDDSPGKLSTHPCMYKSEGFSLS